MSSVSQRYPRRNEGSEDFLKKIPDIKKSGRMLMWQKKRMPEGLSLKTGQDS